MKNFLSWMFLVVICCSVLGPVWEISPVLYYCCYAVLVSGVVIQWLALAFPILPMHFEGNTSQKSDARLLSHHLLIVLLIVLLGIPSGSVAFPYVGRLLLDFKSRMVHHPWWALCVVMVGIPVGYHLFLSIISILKNHKKAEEYVHDREEGRCPKGVEEQELPPDELSRTPIVELLYERLMECCEGEYREDGFNASRVGLFGTWGEGKTFVLKMLRRKILCPGENEDLGQCKKLELVDFNPWNCLDRKMQPTELFESIAKAVVRRTRRDIGGISRRFANSISDVDCRKFIAAVPNIGALLSVIWEFVFRADAVADKLKGELQRLDYHIVVVIDNVDRLPADDICDLLRLISTHGDLPNIIYLVAADKAYMARAIQEKLVGNAEDTQGGHRYLEKIFTKRAYLPIVPMGKLVEIFNEKLRGFVAKEKFMSVDDLNNACLKFTWSNLRTARDVEVLIDAIIHEYRVLKDAFSDYGVPNIDGVDFIVLTTVKYYDENFYRVLFNGMTEVFKNADPFGLNSKVYSEDELKVLFFPLGESRKDEPKWSLYKDFLEDVMGMAYHNDKFRYAVNWESAASTFRLRSPTWFEYYFTGLLPKSFFITKAKLQSFYKWLKENQGMMFPEFDDKNRCDFNVQLLRTFALGADVLQFDCFSAYVRNVLLFTKSLMEKMSDPNETSNIWRNVDYLFSSLCLVLQRRPDEEQHKYSRVLLEEFKYSENIPFVARSIRLERHNHFDGESLSSAWLTSADYHELCAWYYERVKKVLESNGPMSTVGSILVIKMWRYVAVAQAGDKTDDVKVTLGKASRNFPGVLWVIDFFLGEIIVNLPYYDQEINNVNYEEICDWLGGEYVDKIVNVLNAHVDDLSISNFIYFKMLEHAVCLKQNEKSVGTHVLLDYIRLDDEIRKELKKRFGLKCE